MERRARASRVRPLASPWAGARCPGVLRAARSGRGRAGKEGRKEGPQLRWAHAGPSPRAPGPAGERLRRHTRGQRCPPGCPAQQARPAPRGGTAKEREGGGGTNKQTNTFLKEKEGGGGSKIFRTGKEPPGSPKASASGAGSAPPPEGKARGELGARGGSKGCPQPFPGTGPGGPPLHSYLCGRVEGAEAPRGRRCSRERKKVWA